MLSVVQSILKFRGQRAQEHKGWQKYGDYDEPSRPNSSSKPFFQRHSSTVQKITGQCSVILPKQKFSDVHTLNKGSNVQCMTSVNIQSFCWGLSYLL